MDAEAYAKLVQEMIYQKPWCEQSWARLALAVAARAIRRGRHLTESEKLHNLATAMEEDPGETEEERAETRAAAQRLRDIAGA